MCSQVWTLQIKGTWRDNPGVNIKLLSPEVIDLLDKVGRLLTRRCLLSQ